MSSETSTNDGFHVSHFFVLLSLLAATVAVVMARPSAPEQLILISLTIGAAGLAGLCFYRLLAPLVAPHREVERQALSARIRVDLEREKALTLRSIKELEFDRAMGKVSAQDFDEMAGRLRQRALGIMKQLDAGASAYRVLIEKELAARVGSKRVAGNQTAARATGGLTGDQTVASATGGLPGTASAPVALPIGAVLCACGTSNDTDARFCKSCGTRLGTA